MASFYADSIRNLHRVGNRGGIREVVTMDYFAGVCCCACVMQVSVIRIASMTRPIMSFPSRTSSIRSSGA